MSIKIHLLTSGNLNDFEKKIFDEYKKRITFCQIILKQINIKGDLSQQVRIEKESDQILKYIHSLNENSNLQLSKNKICLLDIFGKNYTSEDFYKNIIRNSIENSIIKNLIFIIGGSFGVNQAVKLIANQKLSFGLNTWPHNLMKIMLIEQIFRSQTIHFEKNYHH